MTFSDLTKNLIEYDICQNETEYAAEFTYTDTVSKLSSTPNFCGSPVVLPVYSDNYDQNLTSYLTIVSFSGNNSGYFVYAPRMCDRKFARSTPYQFKVQLQYQKESV